jgi:hypothetical protein
MLGGDHDMLMTVCAQGSNSYDCDEEILQTVCEVGLGLRAWWRNRK